MFIEALSEEAYLDVVTRYSHLDFYQDKNVDAVSLEVFVGYISVNKFPEDKIFSLIFDPIHNRYFVPVRQRRNEKYLIATVWTDDDNEELLITSGLINSAAMDFIKKNDIDVDIVRQTYITTYESYEILAGEPKCS